MKEAVYIGGGVVFVLVLFGLRKLVEKYRKQIFIATLVGAGGFAGYLASGMSDAWQACEGAQNRVACYLLGS